jgi:predicted nuclease of predicted toxin-antitoxin system
MKLLFDQNIPYRVAKKLQDVFPGCSHVSDCSLSNCDDIIIGSLPETIITCLLLLIPIFMILV